MDDGSSGNDVALEVEGAAYSDPDAAVASDESLDGRGDGQMLDPSWTPERGRSHVAALAGLAMPEEER